MNASLDKENRAIAETNSTEALLRTAGNWSKSIICINVANILSMCIKILSVQKIETKIRTFVM